MLAATARQHQPQKHSVVDTRKLCLDFEKVSTMSTNGSFVSSRTTNVACCQYSITQAKLLWGSFKLWDRRSRQALGRSANPSGCPPSPSSRSPCPLLQVNQIHIWLVPRCCWCTARCPRGSQVGILRKRFPKDLAKHTEFRKATGPLAWGTSTLY